MPDTTVVIEDGTIREIVPDRELRLGGLDPLTLDATGRTVLPGLMDAHIHLCIPAHPDDPGADDIRVTDRSAGLAAVYGVANARALLLGGITSVRDAGAHGHSIFAVKHLVDTGQVPGPRIIASGRAIAMTGGHGGNIAAWADGPDEVRKVARTELAAGAGNLKLMASGSGAAARESPYDVELSQEELAAAVREAKAYRRTTCAHVTNPTAARNAILAGVDSIEHGVAIDEESIALLKDHDVAYVPTVWAYHFVGEHGKYLATSQAVMDDVRTRYEIHHENVSRARAAGVSIVAGTDSALPMNPPDCLKWELQWLVSCGLSPMDAIRAATANAARLMQVAERLGTLEVGKRADLLAVDGDPLVDIAALTRTWHVLQDGVVCVREGRSALEDFVRNVRPMPDGPFPDASPIMGAPELVAEV